MLLLGFSCGTSRTVQYYLDGLGNRSFMSDTNPPTSSDSKETLYWYNSFDQLTSKSQSAPPFATTNFAYDNNSNLLSETRGVQVKSYSWDLDNRLRQVTLPGAPTNLFDYDANGLRIRKNDSTGTIGFLLDGPSVMEELNASGSTVTSYLTNPQVIDEIDSFQQAGVTYYPLTDALGSVYAVTHSSGIVVATYGYDVYGARTQVFGTLALSFGYAGREHDTDTGQIYQRARGRDPRTGGWLQADSLGFTAGPNPYVYVNAQPAMATDPTGLCEDPGGPGVRFCISAFIPTERLVSRDHPFLFGLGRGDNRGPEPYLPPKKPTRYRIQQKIRIVGTTATETFDIGESVGPLGIAITGTSPIHSAYLSGGILDAIGSGHSEMAGYIANVGTILYDFHIQVNPQVIGLFCGIAPLVSGERTNYPSFEVWAYQDGASPTLLYQFDAKAAGTAVEDLHTSTTIRGL